MHRSGEQMRGSHFLMRYLTSKFLILQGVAAVGLAALIAGTGQAAEGPVFNVTIENVITADTVTLADGGGNPAWKAHVNFPYMHQRHDGTLLATYNAGQTQSGLAFGKQAISSDGGLTWTASTTILNAGQIQLVKPPGQNSVAFSVGLTSSGGGQTTWANSNFLSTDGGTTWVEGVSNFDSNGVNYLSVGGGFGDVLEVGSTLFMPAFAKRPSVSTFEQILLASTDGGINWNRRSTVSEYIAPPNIPMGVEGPAEGTLLDLDNGNLLTVFRTGQPLPTTQIDAGDFASDPEPFGVPRHPSLFFSVSSDSGFTWSSPKTLGVMGVFPLLRKLDDGSVALTYGRYGAKVMFADPTGKRWSTPTVIYDGPTSGHTEMRRRSDGKYVYVHDQSGFFPPGWNPGPAGYVYDNNQSANLLSNILDIQQVTVVEEFNYDLEYHGDNTPGSLPVAWDLDISGGPSVFLWADQGQDYMRLDGEFGGAGPSKTVFYSLAGTTAGSEWANVNFTQGEVIEFRARAGSASTAEGSAVFFFGDGDNGAITVELTGDRVNLEGLGGNGGQVEYTASGNPGFSTLDWHDFRLEIEPDLSQGGQITASLFLDGDWVTPILTQLLDPSLLDEIRFGDESISANGILDVDYLRFARVSIPGDFDGNGFVDSLDLAAWKAGFGTLSGASIADGDADDDQDVDGADFLIWQRQFTGPPPLSASSAVPEPTTLVLISMAVAALLTTPRNWARNGCN